ncbi:2111_t:CDS:2, partial [Racocetra fulgida]
HLAKAYSLSWVYEDLVAFPQYKIILSNKQIPNSSLENFVFDEVQSVIPSVSKDNSKDGAESKSTPILMRSASGQPYLCQIPFVVNQTAVEENKQEEKRDDVDLMKKGLALLEPMKSTYILGKYNFRFASLPPSNKDSNDKKNSFGTDLQVGSGKKYLVQRWGGGSTCDLTGKPRQVEIQEKYERSMAKEPKSLESSPQEMESRYSVRPRLPT